MIGIYRIYHCESGKSYVGQSVDIQRRILMHYSGTDTKMYMDRAIQKCGSDVFSWEVLEVCSESNLDVREMHWIAALDCVRPNGYNLKTGGGGGRHSVQTRAKMSKSRKGRKFSDKHRESLRQAHTGRKHSAETRKRLSEMNAGENNPMYGKPRSAEVRRKVSESHKRRYAIPGNNHHSLGRKRSPEEKAKISKGAKLAWKKRKGEL